MVRTKKTYQTPVLAQSPLKKPPATMDQENPWRAFWHNFGSFLVQFGGFFWGTLCRLFWLILGLF